jgi:hypothetical protein
MISMILWLSGCAGYTFEPIDTPPATEHEAIVKSQQNALSQQQKMLLNN